MTQPAWTPTWLVPATHKHRETGLPAWVLEERDGFTWYLVTTRSQHSLKTTKFHKCYEPFVPLPPSPNLAEVREAVQVTLGCEGVNWGVTATVADAVLAALRKLGALKEGL